MRFLRIRNICLLLYLSTCFSSQIYASTPWVGFGSAEEWFAVCQCRQTLLGGNTFSQGPRPGYVTFPGYFSEYECLTAEGPKCHNHCIGMTRFSMVEEQYLPELMEKGASGVRHRVLEYSIHCLTQDHFDWDLTYEETAEKFGLTKDWKPVTQDKYQFLISQQSQPFTADELEHSFIQGISIATLGVALLWAVVKIVEGPLAVEQLSTPIFLSLLATTGFYFDSNLGTPNSPVYYSQNGIALEGTIPLQNQTIEWTMDEETLLVRNRHNGKTIRLALPQERH